MEPGRLRVVVSSLGRFWAVDLALQLQTRGSLTRLYTAHPWWRIEPELRAATATFPWFFGATRLLARRLPRPAVVELEFASITTFDRWTAGRLQPCDVFVHLSSVGRNSAARAHRLGARVVCDRGSTHIEVQDQILRDEHDRHGIRYRGIDRRLIERELEEYARADAIAVPSTFARRSFVARGVAAAKVHVLPFGVDLSMFRRCPREDTRFRLIFVGAYSLRKGIGYLFDAARPLVKRGLIELWLVGDKTDETQDLLGRNRDIFVDHGLQNRGRLSWYFCQADALVLPSIEEGLALVQAQAMACGVPVIATTNTGAEDLFTDGVEGFIVPIRDVAALRERIEILLDDDSRRTTMAEAALHRVQALGGWNEYGERALELYGALAMGTRREAQ